MNSCFVLVLIALFFIGCRPSMSPGDSDLRQLFKETVSCDVNHERKEQIRSKYGKNIVKAQGRFYQRSSPMQADQDVEDVLDHLSNLPDPYLQWMFEQHKVTIRITPPNDNKVAGLTQNRGTAYFDRLEQFLDWSKAYPEWIMVEPKKRNFLAILHETGHANISYLAQQHPNFQTETIVASQNSLRIEGHRLRDNPKENYEEWVSEAFDSYYCGDTSRQKMQNEANEAWKFARAYFLPHEDIRTDIDSGDDNRGQNDLSENDNSGPGADPTRPNEADPGEDRLEVPTGTQPANPDDIDDDGVPNEHDGCSNSPKGFSIWLEGDWRGCAANQLLDAEWKANSNDPKDDADEDGIPNFEDACTNTPAKAKVWTHSELKGCSSGQLVGM